MAKMEAMAQKFDDSKNLAFIAINTNNFDLAKQHVQLHERKSSCYQMFVNADEKKLLVDCLKIKRVPHLALLDECGNVLMNGKEFDWDEFPAAAGVSETIPPAPAHSFSLDEDF
jgi:hypothetical protein